MKEVRGEAPMSIPQPDLFTNPNDLQRNTLQLQTRIVQIAMTDSWKIWNPGSSQIRPRFRHKYSWKWVLWVKRQTGGGAKSALALDWIDLERFWQCKSLNWHLPESKKVCKYGATMHIEGSRSLWRKNYLSGGVRSSNWLSSQLENLTRHPPKLFFRFRRIIPLQHSCWFILSFTDKAAHWLGSPSPL